MTTTPTTGPGRLPDPRRDHYLQLAHAQPVPTIATRTTEAAVINAVKHRSMACIHGDVGLGKTFAAHAALRAHAPDTLRLQIRQAATMSEIRGALWRALQLDGNVPTKADPADEAIKQALSLKPHTLLCDEAHWLAATALEFFLHLWNTDTTDIAIVFVGAENTRQKIHTRRALASRINFWQQFSPLTPEEVRATIPQYHPVWRDADPEDILFADDHCCHGNFRNWANLTSHIQDATDTNPNLAVDRNLIRGAMSRMDSTFRATRP